MRVKKEEEMAFVKPNMTKKVDLSLEGIRGHLLINYQKKLFKKALKLAFLYVMKVDRLESSEKKMPYWAEIVGCLKDGKLVKEVIKVCKEILGMAANNGPEKAEVTRELVGILGTVAFWFTKKELQADNDIFWKTLLNSMTAFIAGDFGSIGDAVVYLDPQHKVPEVVKSLVFAVMNLVSSKEKEATVDQCQALKTLAKKSLLAYPQSQNLRLLYNDVLLFAGHRQGLLLPTNEDGKKIPAQFPADFRLMEVFRGSDKPTQSFSEKCSAAKIGLLQYPHNRFYQKSVQEMVRIEREAKEPSSKSSAATVSSDEAFKLCKNEKDRLLVSHFGWKSDGSNSSFSLQKRGSFN